MLDTQSNDKQAEGHNNTIKHSNTFKQDVKKNEAFLLNRVTLNMFYSIQPSKECTWLFIILMFDFIFSQPIL